MLPSRVCPLKNPWKDTGGQQEDFNRKNKRCAYCSYPFAANLLVGPPYLFTGFLRDTKTVVCAPFILCFLCPMLPFFFKSVSPFRCSIPSLYLFFCKGRDTTRLKSSWFFKASREVCSAWLVKIEDKCHKKHRTQPLKKNGQQLIKIFDKGHNPWGQQLIKIFLLLLRLLVSLV